MAFLFLVMLRLRLYFAYLHLIDVLFPLSYCDINRIAKVLSLNPLAVCNNPITACNNPNNQQF